MAVERNSAAEWIKILAIVLVVITHAVPDTLNVEGYDNLSPTDNVNFFFIGLLSGTGLIGDVLFLTCSCWYLSGSNRGASVKKICYMIITVFIVSVIWLVTVLALGYELSAGTIVRQIFPTLFQNNWYISYYLVFYAIHPLLNILINRLDKLGHGILAGILFVHCYILMWITNTQLGVNKLLIFVAAYFAVSWLKRYAAAFNSSKKANIILCVCSVAAYLIFKTAINFIGLHTDYFNGKMLGYMHIYCPIILAFAVSLINLANMKHYVNRGVNHVASLSMLIYIIHRNVLFATYIQPRYYEWVINSFGIEYMIPFIFLLAAILFAASFALGTLYKFTLARAVNRLSEMIERLFMRAVKKFRRQKTGNPSGQ